MKQLITLLLLIPVLCTAQMQRAALDELGKFFGHVNDEAMKTVSVTFPEKLADQVEIKEEIKE